MEVKAKTMRLDAALVARKLVSSRSRGETLIGEGAVAVNGEVMKRKSFSVGEDDVVTLLKKEREWVSRGALKLEHALDRWKIDPKGKIALDIGAGTGGFTEVLLSRGAKKVVALDVGHGQLAARLRGNTKVVNMEGTHIERVTLLQLKKAPDLIVVDVSFISLEKVLPKVRELLSPDGAVILLIKPQFEVGKERVGKGIVADPQLHSAVARKIESAVERLGFTVLGVIASPILGGSGNKEFLLYAKRG